MKTSDFTITLLFDKTPEEVFKAVNNVRGWWSEKIKGESNKLNDEFEYRFEDLHYSKQKLIEVIPNEKVVWQVTDSKLSFIKDHDEWTGTKIRFEITRKGNKTQLEFSHEGLTPEIECYNACSDGWTQYIKQSLFYLITTGTGDPKLEGRRLQTMES